MNISCMTVIMLIMPAFCAFTDCGKTIRNAYKGEISDVSVPDGIKTYENDSNSLDSIAYPLPDDLSPFRCIVDTLNSAGDDLVHVKYFLYDITGDGQPELWVQSGTCEADKNLWVFTNDTGKPRKILSTYGGHIEFFLKGDMIGSATYNTGEGYVSIYSYDGTKIKVKSAKFSMWNEKGETRALKKKEQPIISLWEDSDSEIKFIFLK